MPGWEFEQKEGREIISIASVNAAATLAVLTLIVVQRLIGHVQQATHIIALDWIFFARQCFGFIARRIHQARSAFKILLVRPDWFAPITVIRARGSVRGGVLMTHKSS
jgi:hypothetical protein